MNIELRGIVFSYKKKSRFVLDGADMTLNGGELTALTGANGSGKTTLTKIILGLIKEKSGEVLFDGGGVKKSSAGKRAERVGYLFQNTDMQLFAPTVREELYFPFEFKKELTDEKKNELDGLLARFGLEGAAERFPLTLSGGEKQRLALAAVMSRGVEYLILDEPTSGVDADGRNYLKNFISEFVDGGGGVLLITHDEDFLEDVRPDKQYYIDGGRVYECR